MRRNGREPAVVAKYTPEYVCKTTANVNEDVVGALKWFRNCR